MFIQKGREGRGMRDLQNGVVCGLCSTAFASFASGELYCVCAVQCSTGSMLLLVQKVLGEKKKGVVWGALRGILVD